MTVLKKIEEGVSFKKASSLPINPNKDEIASIVIVCRQVYLSKPKYYPNLTFYYIEYQ